MVGAREQTWCVMHYPKMWSRQSPPETNLENNAKPQPAKKLMATRRSKKPVWTPEHPWEMQEQPTAKTTRVTVGFISMSVKCLGEQGIEHIHYSKLWCLAAFKCFCRTKPSMTTPRLHVENVSLLSLLCTIKIASLSINNRLQVLSIKYKEGLKMVTAMYI